MTTDTPFQQLWQACAEGWSNKVRQLVRQGPADLLTQKNWDDDLLIHAAAANGHLEIVQFLIEAGQPIDAVGFRGTPLYEAACAGQLPVVKYLLEHGADINVRDSSGSPIMGSLHASNSTHVTMYLLEQGAATGSDITDEIGSDLLDWVLIKDNDVVFSAMAKRGLLPKYDAESALDYVVSSGKAVSGAIPRIVHACLNDPSLSGELAPEHLNNLATYVKDPVVRHMLLSKATELSVVGAIVDDSTAARRPTGCGVAKECPCDLQRTGSPNPF